MTKIAGMSVSEIKSHISNLELPSDVGRTVAAMKASAPDTVFDTTLAVSASVAGSTVITFLGDLPRETREDVENSFEFARLWADSQVKKVGGEWIQHYFDILAAIGWGYTSHFKSVSKLADRGLTMDKVALDLLTTIVTGLAVPELSLGVVLKTVSSTFEALKEQKGPMTLFKERTSSGASSGFQAAVCEVSGNGFVQVKIGCVRCKADMNHTKVIFWDWSKSSVETVTAQAAMSLGIRFENVRDDIRAQLKKSMINSIANIEI